jgi:hypothetical protein
LPTPPGAQAPIRGWRSVDPADGTLEARLLLSERAARTPGGCPPGNHHCLAGIDQRPRRTIDAAALANWLALRAVEQSKKLDAPKAASRSTTRRSCGHPAQPAPN